MGSRGFRTVLAAVFLATALSGCGMFNCAASGDAHRSAGACGAHTTFLR